MSDLTSKKNSSALPLIAAYVGYSVWGLGNMFISIAQRSGSPGLVLSHRFLISALVMLILVLTKAVKVSFKGKNLWPAVLLVSTQCLYYLVESYAIRETNTTLTGASSAVSPVIAIVMAMLFLKEFPTKRQAFFCLFPIVGVILMTIAGKDLGVVTPMGILFLALTVLTSGAYKTSNRKASEQFSSFERTFMMLTTSAISFTISAFAEVGWDLKAYVAPLKVPSYIGSVLTLALLCSIGCNLLANYATGKLSVVKSSSFGAILTLVSMVAGVVFLHEPISWALCIGAVLILFGIYEVTKVKVFTYRDREDTPFLPKDIFSAEMFRKDLGAYVLEGEFGKCYEVKFSKGVVTSAVYTSQPGTEGTPVDCDFATQECFMYVCRHPAESLVIYVNEPAPIYIGERTILQEKDTKGPWFVPKPVGSISDPDGTFGNYQWTAQQVIDNLYEPYRNKYPDYITRTHLGKDQTGTYDMYGYVYTPKNYKTTFFLTGGVHANEESAYYSLAKLMQLVSDASDEQDVFYTLRQNVRFVVIPIVNVWGVSQNHDRSQEEIWKRIRYNGEKVDLNRDFGEATQQETKNVLAFFRNYADTVDLAMDFHNSKKENCSLWYNFINFSVNSQVNYRVTNHMYHRLMELGLCEKTPYIEKIPGRYFKSSMYLEGRIWNEFKVPTITVEHVINSTFPGMYSDEGLTLGVETYGNFLIQNALFFISKA